MQHNTTIPHSDLQTASSAQAKTQAKSVKLRLRPEQHRLVLINLETPEQDLAFGDFFPESSIDSGVIGHWVEVHGPREQCLYRRYLPNLIPTYPATRLRRGKARAPLNIEVTIPYLPNATSVKIWEQAFAGPQAKQPTGTELFFLNLDHPLSCKI